MKTNLAWMGRKLKRSSIAGAPILAALAVTSFALFMAGPAQNGTSANAQPVPRKLPAPPSSGELGFVVSSFTPPFIPGMEACPKGVVPRLRDAYLLTLPERERERLKRPENAQEYDRRWQSYALGPDGTNICSQPDMFDRPAMPVVESPYAWGLDLDGDQGVASSSKDGCPQQDFTSPRGEKGIDNQEYRVMGCTPEWRGADGSGGDSLRGAQQFHQSGEWTQVLLLRGVTSLVSDDDVEVIYANTPDRPVLDSAGKFLRGQSYSISNKPPRHRNVLRAKIVNGVLTTQPADIALAQTWGQGGVREIRGARTKFDFRRGRLRLTFQPDGSITGILGGYRPVFDLINAPALGGVGSATVAGIDCAQQLATAKRMADGLRDPKTGQCTAISSAMQIQAIPAFINDVPRQANSNR